MKKKNNIFQILLSFIDHTSVGLAHHSERKARRHGDTRAHQRSHHGIWDIHRKYARRRANAHGEGVLTVKCRGDH